MGDRRNAFQTGSDRETMFSPDPRLVLQLADHALERGHREWAEYLITMVYEIFDADLEQ